MTEGNEPETTQEASTTGEPSPAAWRRALPTAAVLAVVAVLAIGRGAWLLADPPETSQDVEAADRQDAILAGERFASTLTSYDATASDEYVGSLTGMLAGGKEGRCWDEVTSFVPVDVGSSEAQAAAERGLLYDGTVRERAVETIDSDSARVMLAVDSQVTAVVKEQRVVLTAQSLRMRLDLESHDGEWLVGACSLLTPQPADGGGS